MKTKIILLAFVILFSSCKDDSTSPKLDEGFSVKITVKNSSGIPVSGLRISSWNHLSLPPLGINKSSSETYELQKSSSTIVFAVPVRSYINLILYEADRTPLDTIVNEQKEAGLYSCTWSINAQKPTRVYKHRMTAKDTSGVYLFTDSSYALLWQPDAEVSILGWTQQNGTFETKDKLLFPNSLNLPPLIHTSENGPEPLRTFSIRDTVTIVLTDTATHRQMTFVENIRKDGENNIQLVWNPTLAKEWLPKEHSIEYKQTIIRSRQSSIKNFDWKLYQNYPNPFN